MIDSIFLSTSLILGITIFIAFLVHVLRQPLIISYIITGIIVGPVFLNLLNSGQQYFQVFAEFGVILLLFLVGLSLNFHFLKKIGKVSSITGIGQVIFTSLVGFLILMSLGFEKQPAIYLAIAITFSSTIIITKLLAEKRETETVYGRYTVGLMLVQDIVAIILLILLPAFKDGNSIFLSMAFMLAKSFLFLILVHSLSRLIMKLLDKVAKSGEFLLIFTIAWCFSIAGLAKWMGLSLEIGAIVAGISLGSSVYQAEISSRIRPLRDFFIVLFFIILGSEMQIENFGEIIIPGIILTIFVLVGNPLILYTLYRFMKFTRRISFKAGLTAAQVSEFGFVFLFIVVKEGCTDERLIPIFTFVALSTIFISSYLITYNSQIYKKFEPFLRLFGKDKYKSPEEKKIKYEVLVFGYHRLGWKVCETLKELKTSFAVVDFDPRAIKKLKERGIPYYFGDATDVELLSEIPLEKAKMIISTMPSTHSQLTMIKNIREMHTKPIIVATLAYSRFLEEMYEAGADYIMLPHLICGDWMDNVLKNEAWNRHTMKKLIREQKEQRKLKFNLPIKKEESRN
jgi:Kef-type K+ transport system membrane component KefB